MFVSVYIGPGVLFLTNQRSVLGKYRIVVACTDSDNIGTS